MIKRAILSLAATTLLALAQPASAAFVETDWQTDGDARATLDTDTGIEWLDLNETYNLSLNDMNARLNGGDLQGWRYATFDEAMSLLSRFFDSPIASWSSQFMPGADYTLEEITLWRNLFGNIANGTSMGAVQYDQANWNVLGVYHYAHNNVYVTTPSGGYFYAPQNGYSGYFIVSDGGNTLSSINNPHLNANNPNAPALADVPVPAGLGVMAALSLLGWRRRQA